MDMQTYHDAVWAQVEEQGGPMESVGRQANADLIEVFRENGLNPHQTALVVVELVTRTHQTLKHCFPLFEDLGKTVKFMGHLVDEGAHVADAMTRMLEAKVLMAQVYNFISLIGPGADVDDLPPVTETQAMVEESEGELAEWYERLKAASGDGDA